jgi:hypothetical protein
MLEPSSCNAATAEYSTRPRCLLCLPCLALQTTASSGVSGEQALAEVLHLTQDIFAAVGEEMQRAADAELRECRRCCCRCCCCCRGWALSPLAVLAPLASDSENAGYASTDPTRPTPAFLPYLQSGSRSSRQRLTSCERRRHTSAGNRAAPHRALWRHALPSIYAR